MARIPYARVLLLSIAATVVLTVLLTRAGHHWIEALNLAQAITFTSLTLILALRALVAAVIEWIRRNRDDPFGRQRDFDLAG